MNFLSISSHGRTTGNNNDFLTRYTNPIRDVKRMKLLNVIVPATYHMVMTGINDKIYIYAGAVLYTATLTDGNYDSTTFPAHVETQINAAYTPDNNFTVALSGNDFTITHSATNFQLTFGTNTTASARKLIGFSEADTTAGLSQTSDILYSWSHADSLYIHGNLVDGRTIIDNSIYPDIFCILPANANFGELIYYDAGKYDFVWDFDNPRTFKDADLKITFDGSTLVPLNGGEWKIVFQVFY